MKLKKLVVVLSIIVGLGLSASAQGQSWKLKMQKPAMMKFDSAKDYFWILKTNKGTMRIKLWPDIAPMHATSTIYLTEKKFYDGIIFHRIIPGFMAQGGCPMGSGRGGPGYKYAGEFKNGISHNRPFLLSMANAGPNTDGSQFFITFKPTPFLDRKHSLFGEVVDGQDVVRKLEVVKTGRGDRPNIPVVIEKATIEIKDKVSKNKK